MILFDFRIFPFVVIVHSVPGSICLVPSVRVVIPEVVERFVVVVLPYPSFLGLVPDGGLDLFTTPLMQEYRLEKCLAANPDVCKQV